MKQLSKKCLSLLLAFMLALGMLPTTAWAAEPLPDYAGDWTYFRGNPENNGVTDAETPASAETAVLKWAQKYGSGWSAAPTPPLILNDCLYIAVSNKVLILDKTTGEKQLESEPMAGNVGFAMNPIAYGGGMIFVPLGSGRIQALRADTLELLWVSKKFDGIAQTNSPVMYRGDYVYSGIWNGEEKPGSYFCLDAQTGELVWTLEQMGGFYWAGAYVADNYLIVGSGDSTPENDYTESAVLFSLDPATGEVIDKIENIKGDIRSSICYDGGSVYFATKGGWFCTVAVNEDGSLDKDSLQTVDLKGMCTGTPMVYNGRAYIGSSGAQQFSGPGYLNVIDLSGETAALAYRAELPGYPQASALATSAYGDTAHIYITYNQSPGGIYAIEDEPGQTEARGYDLFLPDKALQQYCICSLVCDADGTLYYKNDSCYLMAVSSNTAYLTDLTADVGTFSQAFAAGTLTYELVVPQGTEQVTLTATPCEGGSVTINGGESAPVTLTAGTATAEITVTKGGDERAYTVSIRERSSNAKLSNLSVNESNAYGSGEKELTPTFASEQELYLCYGVSDSRKFVNLWPEAQDKNAAVKVYALSNVDPDDVNGDGTLDVTASNAGHDRYALYFEDGVKPMSVRVEVTAEDGMTKESYTVLMTKAAAGTVSYAASLSMERSMLLPSGTATLTAAMGQMLGAGTPEALTWTSSNPAAATVDANGAVTYVGKGVTTVTAAGALASASCTVTCGTPEPGNLYVTVSAYDYTAKDAGLTGASATGEIVYETVEVPTTATAAQAVEAAFAAADVDVTIADTGYGPYVSAINGLAAGTGGGMSGWLLSYNEDGFSNLGLGALTLTSGDRLSFHYSVNPDGATDDVGNGWYGLPIVSSLTLAGRTVTMSKETTYGDDFSSTTAYYIHSQQGAKVKLQGSGTAAAPFQLLITLPYGTDLTGLTAAYTTSLNSHYRVIEGLDGERDYTSGLSFSLAAKGGQYKTYYKVLPSTESGGGTSTPGSNISVSFRLIGSTLSGGDVDLGGAGYQGASYQTWLKTGAYTLKKGAKVYDLFTEALDDAGLRYTGADRNYVDTIYAPAAAGGYALSEFTNGPRSGWMYTVNGSHPSFGLKEWTLHEGDSVVWHYVNDYSYEVEDWFNDPDYPSLGDGTYYNSWLKAADTNPSAPSGGGGASTGKEDPVTELKPAAAVDKNGEAKAQVSAKDMETAVADAKKNGAASIVITPTVKGEAAKVGVELPRESVAAMVKDTKAKLTVKTGIADISISNTALGELAGGAGKTMTVSAETLDSSGGKSVRVEVQLDGKPLNTLKGGLTVALPVSRATAGTVLMLVSGEGSAIIRKSAVDGAVLTALLPGSATVMVKDNTQTFADVDGDHWGRDAVTFAAAHALFDGTGEDAFSPAADMSRAMLVTVLARLEGVDTAGGETWYSKAADWAKAEGVTDGTALESSITRESLAVMLYRYAGSPEMDGARRDDFLAPYADAGKMSDWAGDAMLWAVQSGILRGSDNKLNPAGPATRAEVAAMLQRFIPQLLK